MALREVLKSRTSSANQKSLTQAMEARLEKVDEPVVEGEKADVEMATEAAASS